MRSARKTLEWWNDILFWERKIIMKKKHIVKITVVMVVSAIILCLAGCFEDMASAGDKKAAVIGTWELTSESSRGTRTRTLKINEDFTGVYIGRNRETPVTDLKLKGDQLSFKVKMEWRDREFTMDFDGTVKGNSIEGTWTTSRGVRDVIGKKI